MNLEDVMNIDPNIIPEPGPVHHESMMLVPDELRGFVDFVATPTRIVPESERSAIAHMFVLDRRAGRTIENGRLELRLTKLADRKFDGCELVSDNSVDLAKMLPLWTFKSATATLIDDRHVLTAGHATIEKDLQNTYFLFGRTKASDDRDVEDGKLSIPLTDPRIARAVRVVAIENDNPEKEGTLLPDWSIIEIEWLSATQYISPISLAESVVLDDHAELVGHSLGTPQLAAKVRWVRTPESGLARLFADLGSGGSGSPVISNGKVIGVVRGNAEFTKDQRRQQGDGCKLVVTPRAHNLRNAHLVTLVSRIHAHRTEGA